MMIGAPTPSFSCVWFRCVLSDFKSLFVELSWHQSCARIEF